MTVAIGVAPWAAIPDVQAQAGRRRRVTPWFWLPGEARLVTRTRATDGPTIDRTYRVAGGDDRSLLVEVQEESPDAPSPTAPLPGLRRIALEPDGADDDGRLLEALEDVPTTTTAGTFVTSYRRVLPADDRRADAVVETWTVAQLPLPVRRRTTWRHGERSLVEVTELVALLPTQAPPPRSPSLSRFPDGARLETVTRAVEVQERTVTTIGCRRRGGGFDCTTTTTHHFEDEEAPEEARVYRVRRPGDGTLHVDVADDPHAGERRETEPAGSLLELLEGERTTVPAGAFTTRYRRVAASAADGPRQERVIETWTVEGLSLPVRRRVTWRIQGHDGGWSPLGEEVTELTSIERFPSERAPERSPGPP